VGPLRKSSFPPHPKITDLLRLREAALHSLFQLPIDLTGELRAIIGREDCNVMGFDSLQNSLRASLWLIERVTERALGVFQPRESGSEGQ
jgi:hypothetical protein